MLNYFQLLGLPTAITLDLAVLEQAYLVLIAAIHPDTGSIKKMEFTAAEVNEAYKTLKQIDSRIEHFLHLHNEEKLPTIEDQGFLLECLEWQDMVEEATNAAALQNIMVQVLADRQQCIESITNLCAAKNYRAANIEYAKLKFYRRMQGLIEHKMEILDEAV